MPKASWGNSPRPVTINVVIDDDTGQGKFHMESDPKGKGVPIVQGFIVQFNNNQGNQYSNGFDVSFCLPEAKGKNASWIFDSAGPIWVKLVDQSGACPQSGKDNSNPPILTNPTLKDPRTLAVTNSNGAAQYFGFALNFKSSGSGGRKLSYDPIGDNQNGNSMK